MPTSEKRKDGESPRDFRERIGHVPTDPQTWALEDIESVGLRVCYSNPPCGCKIVGDGTLPYPLSILFCTQHAGHPASTLTETP